MEFLKRIWNWCVERYWQGLFYFQGHNQYETFLVKTKQKEKANYESEDHGS